MKFNNQENKLSNDIFKMNKQLIIAGNWKMNTDLESAKILLNSIDSHLKLFINDISEKESKEGSVELLKNKNIANNLRVLAFPPYLFINSLNELLNSKKSNLELGAQNCFYENNGAFTGEISALMLSQINIKYVIIGHSERRTVFGENDELLSLKIKSSLDNNLTPIFCIGETLEQRQNGTTNGILLNQIKIGLSKVLNYSQQNLSNIIIAYEPVWAIGTGLTATNEQINETHNFINNEIKNLFGFELPILYGGSLNENNADEILKINNVSGGLIGGASLKSNSFNKIIDIAVEIINS